MAENLNRNILVVNLDPAAEHIGYKVNIDIRDLITAEDVMEEYKLGPNGALVYCLEYLWENLDWFDEQLESITEDDYLLFDCPG